jgi:eukaryotic-like serine/threonine-protein kinase
MQTSEFAESYCPFCHLRYVDDNMKFCRHDGAMLRPIAELGAVWLGRVVDDKYRIVRFLGAGASANVFEAEHLVIGRHVAIKLLNANTTVDASMQERFRQEAQLISLISHPNVVEVEDFGCLSDGTPYMVIELLHGWSLASLLEKGLLGERTTVEIAMQICAGLGAAHDKQIVHRDVKPANVFIHRPEPGSESFVVKLLDLGLAKLVGSEALSNLTMTGTIFGTPEYMSPEQATGVAVDGRTDLYALGVVLYEMLFGTVPFSAPSFIGVLTKHMTEIPKWPDEHTGGSGFDDRWKSLVMALLAKKPEDRPNSARALGLRLQEIARALPQHSITLPDPSSISGTYRIERSSLRPSAIEIVGFEAARGTSREVVELASDVFWVGNRHGVLLECNAYLRRYRGNKSELAILVDPGPPKDLAVISAKITAILGSIGKLDLVFLNHQDPDVCGNAALLQQANPRVHVICSEDTWRLVQFYGLRPQNHSATDSYADERMSLATGHGVRFVPTPYCHFRGAVMYYDEASRVLFSGDLFGGLSRKTTLHYDESAWHDIEIFHELYMPSSLALRIAVERIRRLDPAPILIAPQHGTLIGQAHIPSVLERMERLAVGIELMQGVLDKSRYVALANALVAGLNERLGPNDVLALLRVYNADGSFPNLFVVRDGHVVTDIKVEPRAAIRALVRDALELCDECDRDPMQAFVRSTATEFGLGGILRELD